MEAKMKKILPIMLILLGIAEFIVAFLNIKVPITIAMVLGVLLIAFGVKTLLDIAGNQ